MRSLGPILVVVLHILAIWYVACVPMNVREVLTAAERAGAEIVPPEASVRRDMGAIPLVLANTDHLGGSWSQDRAKLPAPHQVAQEIWASTFVEEVEGRRGLIRSGTFSNRGLIHHTGITLWATVLGFAMGTGMGILLAIGIVHSRTMDMSVMPWAIVSQTIPIVALAPMIIVVLYSVGVQGMLPKAVISAYLSFFPVVVGMVKGLRSPDQSQLDLMHTYNASSRDVLIKLRLPASVPYLFASLKIGIAASLVGAIVGELPVQKGGLGARMLAGSYYGQTTQIWAALFAAALLAAFLVRAVGWIERRTQRAMGLSA
ncbi:ABC transporter permease [Ponticoccus sp. SC2-23]|uniref:ABC transporter permease n=1 Tax=Alexandriicola marinus TaxID=2081710 RepID=UPI000FDB1006|nr:ABC transporter permease [Alexandriicola marinus]MBM1222179.1 ABC transporter permease [Ponticoccus sp. SC6-9]MBM1226866.1 ABC transporter permease [Ponticoccus sp. SC6-15]MBM1231126.1 ABC transporter permease [Ponticoccus sp. SC6-38]MBM1235622.1 ABC transporter permease [Ponticoccus sp. SC6-45]MBM1240148.1 ABC transporter permease [Ponticoccus sp. SC6-49]MBM1244502.1 ABC transporter permease [Ponticoccus sp. SC2-64]MBM1249096.1 ABC transporter permease [Ponticoccus sp. SC6-42]MBM1253803